MFTIHAHEDDDATGVGGFILSVIVSWGKSCERDPRALFDISRSGVYNAYVYTFLTGPEIVLSVLKGTSHLRTRR